MICAGLNEGTWPATPSLDPLLPPAVLRALGVPGADFRIGLSAHDLAGLLGAPEVVLSRSARDAQGPAIPSRFLLRVKALLGRDLGERHEEREIVALARAIDDGEPAPLYRRPEPRPSAEQRQVRISVTALDRLRSDPYQFYASSILRLKELDALDAEPSAAWRGTAAHEVLETWHKTRRPMAEVADEVLTRMNHHPLMRALWRPRLVKALEWVEAEIAANPEPGSDAVRRMGRDRASRGQDLRQGRPHRQVRRRHPGDRRLQDRRPAERAAGDRRLRVAARHDRPDGRARRFQELCRASPSRSSTGRSASRTRA